MVNFKNIFSVGLVFGLAFNISNVNAQTGDSVLLKISKVKSIEDDKGHVMACDVDAVVYNRSNFDLDAAMVTLSWKDDVIDEIINLEEDEMKEQESIFNGSNFRAAASTSHLDSIAVILNMQLPFLKPYSQVEIKTQLKSDKCFLLLQEPEILFDSCEKSIKGNSICTLLKFVSPKSEEYYSDFKKISPEEERERELSANQKVLNQINDRYTQTIGKLQQLTVMLAK